MSSQITATVHQDSAINSIRNEVAARNDGIPFLLLPVRVETRFMTVDRSTVQYGGFPTLLDEVYRVGNLLEYQVRGKHPTPVLKHLDRVNERLKEIAQNGRDLGAVNASYRNPMDVRSRAVDTRLDRMVKDIESLNWSDPEARAELTRLRRELQTNGRNALDALGGLVYQRDTAYQETTALLSHIDDIDDALESVAARDLSTSDYKEKRRVFALVEEKIAQVEHSLVEARSAMAVNMSATTSQLLKLKQKLAQIPERRGQVLDNVKAVRSTYKQVEYNGAFNRLDDKLDGLVQDMQKHLVAKIELRKAMRNADAIDVLNQIHNVNEFLRRQNTRPFSRYEEVKSSREALYKQLHKLRDSVHRIIDGGSEEIKAIRNAWERTDQELERFTGRVEALEVTDRYEKAGLTRTVTHINEEYRKDLDALHPRSPQKIEQISNQGIEESIAVYEEAIGQMRQLDLRLEQAQNAGEKEKALEDLVAFSGKFNTDKRALRILPAEKYHEMKSLSERLDQKLGTSGGSESSRRLNKSASSPDLVRMAMDSLKLNIGAQFTDAQDRKDKFYDDERFRVVFSPTTQTQKELWVRIFPDDIAIHSHEEALTRSEADDGKAYWYEIWAAGADEELKLAAWRSLVASYGPERAAWIVRSLQPLPQVQSTVSSEISRQTNPLLAVNNALAEYVEGLAEGLKQNANAFDVLEGNLDHLKSAEKSMQKVDADTEAATDRTKKLLITAQSRLTKYFLAIEGLSEQEKKQVAGRMTAVVETQETFNELVKSIKEVRTMTTRALVEATLTQMNASEPTFPAVTIKDASWTQVPHSKVMPGRFVVAAMRGGQWRYIEVGNPLPQNQLIVGLDPADFELETFSYDADGNLIVDPKIEWLTDFDAAVDIGMGIWFRIDQSDWDYGFDKLIVLGIKNTNEASGRQLLEQLLDNHHFLPEGAAFLEISTPTNNTEKGPSGFKSYEEDPAVSFAVERLSESGAAIVTDPSHPTDSERLASALGISHQTLAYLAQGSRTQISDALVFNRALFHGTVGEFMEEALDTIFTLDNIERARTFMSNYVAARGFLPSIRVGTQPYGIMPTTAFSRFSWTADDNNLPPLTRTDFQDPAAIDGDLQARFHARLAKLLSRLNGLWTTVRNNPDNPVKHSGNVGSNDPQEHFMEMLGLHANSVENFYYYGLNVAARQNSGQPGEFSVAFGVNDPFRPSEVASAFTDLMAAGYFYTSDSFYDESDGFPASQDKDSARMSRIATQWEKSRVYALRHLDEENQLLGQRIDHRELLTMLQTASDPDSGSPEERYLAQAELDNYIDWLTGKNAWTVHSTNRFAYLNEQDALVAGMPSHSLLFLLLRHSILSAQADAILKILEKEGLVSQKLRKAIGQTKNYYARYGGEMSYVTKWTYLFSKIHSLRYVLGNNMDENNVFYHYMDTRSSGYLNRYVSPEHPWYFNDSPRKSAHQPIINELDETRAAFQRLKNIPTANLDQLLAEHLDLCSYRMDAWYLGLVNKRLEQQRNANSQGIYIGSYGYLEDLRRGAPRVQAAELPEGLWKTGDGPVYTDGDNQGYIHTPSLNHAVTAAILRAGYNANSGVSDVENQMAVNLSSSRVRAALNMVSSIRNGQTPGAVLGYQFERGLHENYLHAGLELDQYIHDFRSMFPLSPQVDPGINLGAAAQTNVVNGLDLLEFAQNFVNDQNGPADPNETLYETLVSMEGPFWATLGNQDLIDAGQAEQRAMLKEIDRMADTFDALGDLCLSESVYQIAQGNHIRAAAIFEKLSKGDVPDEITIADTPRTGTVVTHRVTMILELVGAIDHALTESGPTSLPLAGPDIEVAVAAAGAAPVGWSTGFSPRALLEPTLNKWAGELIGDPVRIKCMAEYTIDQVTTPVEFSLADLDLQPLDVLHLFGTGPLNGGAELNAMVAGYVRSQIPVLPPGFEGTRDDVDVTIRFTERDPAWTGSDFSFYEKSGFIQALRQVVTESGILSADHLHIPGEEEVSDDELRNQDLDELMVRVSNAVARLGLVAGDIEAFYTNEVGPANYSEHSYTNGQVDTLRELLLETAAFGVPGTRTGLDESYGDATGRVLMGALIGAKKAVDDRMARASREMAVANEPTNAKDARVDALLEAAKAVMGPAFRVIPQFVVRNAVQLNEQLALPGNKGLMRSAAAYAMDEWAQGISRVRERMATLDTLAMHAGAFGEAIPEAVPLQLPFALDAGGVAVDHWLGIAFPNGYQPAEDKLSIVMYNQGAFASDPGASKVALLLDEWVEIIPNPEETTGLAFHYDQPNAKAPNSILLAVTPQETGSWSWDDLLYTVHDTVELAKNRAVEPGHLENTYLGQILPGFMYEVVPPSQGEVLPQDDSDALGWQVITNLKANNDTIEE